MLFHLQLIQSAISKVYKKAPGSRAIHEKCQHGIFFTFLLTNPKVNRKSNKISKCYNHSSCVVQFSINRLLLYVCFSVRENGRTISLKNKIDKGLENFQFQDGWRNTNLLFILSNLHYDAISINFIQQKLHELHTYRKIL